MDNIKGIFSPNKDSDASQPDSAKEQSEPPTKERICAFNSIVLILAQIQQGPPFKCAIGTL